MTFVEEEYQVIALYAAKRVAAGRARQSRPSSRCSTYPGRVIKATVDSIVWAQGQGQIAQSGIAAADRCLSAGAGPFPGQARRSPNGTAICSSPPARLAAVRSTPSTGAMIHILRKVILRVGTITDYLVLKLH